MTLPILNYRWNWFTGTGIIALVLRCLEIASVHSGTLAWTVSPGRWPRRAGICLWRERIILQEKPVKWPWSQFHVDGYCVLCGLAEVVIGPAQSACVVQTQPGSQWRLLHCWDALKSPSCPMMQWKKSRDASRLQEKRHCARQYPVEGVNSLLWIFFSFELNSRVPDFFFLILRFLSQI